MARHDFILSNRQKVPLPIQDPAGILVQLEGILRLRKLDLNGNWSPRGFFGTGDMLVETWRPQGVVEFLGFWAELSEDEDKGDIVRFRLSADEGATQLFWDTTALVWRTPAGIAEWNTEVEVDAGISDFPFDGSLTVHVQLTSAQGDTTPGFRGYYIFWEVRYNATEDLIRSIFKKIIDEVDVNADFIAVLEDPADEVVVVDSLWILDDPVFVFNRTDDPLLTTNLFQSRVGNTLKLVALQAGEILVRYRGRLDHAHVAPDADFELQELPAVTIESVVETRVRDFKVPNVDEPLRSRGIVRLRSTPARHNYTFNLVCTSQDVLHDKILADAVRRTFDEKEWVRSLVLDEDFPVVQLEAVSQSNRVADQVFTRTVAVTFSVLEWLSNFRDIPMVLDINQSLRPISCGIPAEDGE